MFRQLLPHELNIGVGLVEPRREHREAQVATFCVMVPVRLNETTCMNAGSAAVLLAFATAPSPKTAKTTSQRVEFGRDCRRPAALVIGLLEA